MRLLYSPIYVTGIKAPRQEYGMFDIRQETPIKGLTCAAEFQPGKSIK
jgi:hypothetical protein